MPTAFRSNFGTAFNGLDVIWYHNPAPRDPEEKLLFAATMELNAYTPSTLVDSRSGGKIDMTDVRMHKGLASFYKKNYELRVGMVWAGSCSAETECWDGMMAFIDCDSQYLGDGNYNTISCKAIAPGLDTNNDLAPMNSTDF